MLDLLGFQKVHLNGAFAEFQIAVTGLVFEDLIDVFRIQMPVENRQMADSPVDFAQRMDDPIDILRGKVFMGFEKLDERLASHQGHGWVLDRREVEHIFKILHGEVDLRVLGWLAGSRQRMQLRHPVH